MVSLEIIIFIIYIIIKWFLFFKQMNQTNMISLELATLL